MSPCSPTALPSPRGSRAGRHVPTRNRRQRAAGRPRAAERAAQRRPRSAEQVADVRATQPPPRRCVASGRRGRLGRTGVATITNILLFLMLQTYGAWVLTAVTREKASRVVEVLLAVIRPIHLLAGKIIGIGLAALGHAVLLILTAYITTRIGGCRDHRRPAHQRPRRRGRVVHPRLCPVLQCVRRGGLAVRRVEDAQGASFPIMLPLLFAYIVSFSAASGPNTLLWVLAFIPPTAVLAMPTLYAIGAAPVWAMLLSMALTAVAILGRRRAGGEDLRTLGPPHGPQAVMAGGDPPRRRRTAVAGRRSRAPSRPTDARASSPTWTSGRRPPPTIQARPGRGGSGRCRGRSSPSTSPSVSLHAANSNPSRLRRTTEVQCPYMERRLSGRPAATTSRPRSPLGEQPAEPRVIDVLGVIDDEQARPADGGLHGSDSGWGVVPPRRSASCGSSARRRDDDRRRPARPDAPRPTT